MDPADFLLMPARKQIQWLYANGEFIMDIRYYEFKISLHLIHDFYVEVFYHHKEGIIERVEILDRKSNRMKFYTDQVKLKVA